MIKTIILALIIVCQANIGFCESNKIHSFKVIKQTSNSVLVELKYYYSGDHGDKAELTAWPLPPGFWGSSIVPLVSGEHTSQLSVTLGPKVPKEVSSDSIEFLYISGGGPPFYKKEFPFKKKWAKHASITNNLTVRCALIKTLERHGRIHTAPSWMESRRLAGVTCGAFRIRRL